MRQKAALALGHYGDPAAIDALAQGCRDSDIGVVFASGVALGQIGTPEALAAAQDAAGADPKEVTKKFASYISKGDEKMMTPLVISLGVTMDWQMAKAFYWSGNDDLKTAAEVWDANRFFFPNSNTDIRRKGKWDVLPKWGKPYSNPGGAVYP